ncbi:MAG: PAS domain S-box protein [Rhodocyclales bacterium]|nr:PAS domain S-box protein [Rhodocyclales bacterium]
MRSSEEQAADNLPLSVDPIDQAFLRLAVGLMLAGSVSFVAIVFYLAPEQRIRSLGGVLLGSVSLIAGIFIHRDKPRQAIRTLAYGMWGVISFMAVLGGGLRAPIFIAYPVLIAMGGWLIGPAAAVGLAGLTLAFGTGLMIADGYGLLPVIEAAPASILWTVYAIVLVSATALTVYASRHHRTLFARQGQLAEAMSAKADALAIEENRLRHITENVPAMIFHGGRDLRCLYANRQFADFFHGGGVPIEGMHLREVLGEPVFEAALPNIERALAGERILLEGERTSVTGQVHCLEISLVPEIGADGGVAGFYALKRDITERKRAEQTLKLTEDKFAKVFRTSPVPISLARSSDGLFADINPAFEAFFGWTRDEIIGNTSTGIGIWRSIEERERWTRALREHGATRNFEVNWRNKAGETRICQISAEFIRIEGEDYILALTFDITERKRSEEALMASQARLNEAQRIGRFGSWELDLASDSFVWSEEITRIFETTAPQEKVNYAVFLKTIHPDDRATFDKTYRQSIAEGKAGEFTYRLCMPDGRIKFVHVRAETRIGADGKPVKSIGSTQDITEQVLARQEIERLNAELEKRVVERTAELTSANRELESFAYSISHDLRAPLRGIDGFSQLLVDEYRDRLDAQGVDYLDRVRRAAQRMGTLIDDILELSRVTRQEMRRVKVDLSQLATELIEERTRAEPGHRADIALAPGCKAFGDPQLLRVMMQNLLENAWKYSGKEASPRIEFGRETNGGDTVFFVRDNGVGFDMQYADRLFAPFQRLHKPEDFEGTGIGLATVARVVHRHGGRIWAESEPGKGALFRFTLGEKMSPSP